MSPATPQKFLTTPEVAKILRVREPVVYSLIHNDGLPARRVGRRWLMDAAELDGWVRSRDPHSPAPNTATVDSAWVAAQVAKFSPDDLRRAGELLLALARADRMEGAA